MKSNKIQNSINENELIRIRERIFFGQNENENIYPDLLNVQLDSYVDFLQENVPASERKKIGLQSAFLQNFPIEDQSGKMQLEFIEYHLEQPKYTERECRERELTFAKPLKAKLRLISKQDSAAGNFGDVTEQDVYLGNLPCMTNRGTFIINGAERVVVSQLHRSPGVFFDDAIHPNGTRIFSARIIPFRGSWVEFTTDINDVMFAYIDRKKKFPVTTLLRALGYSSNEDILDLFKLATFVPKAELSEKLYGRRIASDVVDLETGEIIVSRETRFEEEVWEVLKEATLNGIKLYNYIADTEEPVIVKTLAKDTSTSAEAALEAIYRQLRSSDPPDIEAARSLIDKLFFNAKRYDLGTVGRFRINDKLGLDVSLDETTLRVDDIISIINYLIELHAGKATVDDIDHLGNRRVRTVGEQLTAQFNVGLARMGRTIKERLSIPDSESLNPVELVNARTITSVINQFFGTNQLSQFMDQTNPLAELTNKRRTSALGPGGLSRERAGFEVRDVHYTHYGRLCPIETPEGPNIGLISSLAIHSKINEFGFIETPYKKVVKGIVQSEVEYIPAEREEGKIIAPASTKVDEKGKILGDRVKARQSGDYVVVSPQEVEYIDISTDQITSAAAALIPFLEHDDANRALMGSNMQRQAVPLLRPDAPRVGTGMEARVARDSRAVLLAEGDGIVEYVSADKIIIRYFGSESDDEQLTTFDSDLIKTYDLLKFFRTNQDTSINQRPIVRNGQVVKKNMPIADNSSTDKGELALGRNVLVAFMPWRGYNFEDAIIISEKLIAEDIFTSIHIEEFTLQVRDTKRGEEEFTREIPNVSEEATKELDESGIVRIGAKVREGDILIGKITPKGETDPTPEEKLLRAIFGDKAGDVKDVSLKATPGLKGVVINTKLFTRRVSLQESDNKREEKKRQDALTKAEQLEKVALEKECLGKLSVILGEQVSMGIRLQGVKTPVIRSGVVITVDSIQEYFNSEELKLDKLDLSTPLVKDPKSNELAMKLLENFNAKYKQITDDYKIKSKMPPGDELQPGILQMAKVYIAKKRKLQVGDKMAGRHGNKGIVSKIVPIEDMPFLPDGTPMDIILNPLGVPSRMNLGQLYETALGWAAKKIDKFFAAPIFKGATWDTVGDYLEEAGLPRTGRVRLRDGRTGELFDNEVTVGVIYMLKLSHLVEDKIHARSIGPYSLITQQPLGGKAQFGGQRLGEMEVWALEAYGAAHTLQEMITVKSDDVQGRARMYEAIVKGDNMPNPNIPESFNVLVRELQGLCLDVRID